MYNNNPQPDISAPKDVSAHYYQKMTKGHIQAVNELRGLSKSPGKLVDAKVGIGADIPFLCSLPDTGFDVPAKKPSQFVPEPTKHLNTVEPSGASKRIYTTFKMGDMVLAERIEILLNAIKYEDIPESDISVEANSVEATFLTAGTPLIKVRTWTPTKRRLTDSYNVCPKLPAHLYLRIPRPVMTFLRPSRDGELIYSSLVNRKFMANEGKISFHMRGTDNFTWGINYDGDKAVELVLEYHEYKPRMTAVQFTITLL